MSKVQSNHALFKLVKEKKCSAHFLHSLYSVLFFFDLVIFSVAFVFLMLATSSERHGLFSFIGTILIVFLTYQVFISPEGFSGIISKLHYYITILVAWVAVGFFWFRFRWGKFSKESKADFDSAWGKYEKKEISQGKTPTKDDKVNFAQKFIPYPSQNKNKISFWIIYWSFSMISYFFSDLMRDIINFIVNMVSGVAKAITRRHFGDLMK